MAEKTIRDFQTDVCEPLKPPTPERACPECIPNPDAILEDWTLSDGEPFFNERTCEYQVAVMINQDGDYYRAKELREADEKGIDFEMVLQSFVLPGLRIMLRYYDKDESDKFVCAFPPEFEHQYEKSGGESATEVVTAMGVGFLWGGIPGAIIAGGLEVASEVAEWVMDEKTTEDRAAEGQSGTGDSDKYGYDRVAEDYERTQNEIVEDYKNMVEMRENNISKQSLRCRSIYKQMVDGTLPKHFHSQVTKKIELTTGLPDGSTFEIVIPNPSGLLAYQESNNEIKNPDALELYARAIDFDYGQTPGEPMMVLVSIPSYIMDKVPPHPTPEITDFSGPQEVVLDGPRIYAMTSRLSEALRVYGNYQAYWWQTERATLYQKMMLPDGTFVSQTTGGAGAAFSESSLISEMVGGSVEVETPTDYELVGDPQVFYIIQYQQAIVDFYMALQELLEKNDFRLTAWPNFLGDRAEEVKIVFEQVEPPDTTKSTDPSTPAPSGHFKIKSVWAKYDLCGWHKMKQMGGFLNHPSVRNETIMGYVSRLPEIDTALTAKSTPPWLDFIVQYTYPPLDVRYHSDAGSQGKPAVGGCFPLGEGGAEAFRDWVFNSVMSLGEAVAYQFNKSSCKLLTDPTYRPTEKKWADWRKGQREEHIKRINEHYAREEATIMAAGQRIREKEYKDPLTKSADYQAQQQALQSSRDNRKEALNHPYRSAAIDAALQEFDMDSSLIGLFIDQAELRKLGLGTSIWKGFKGTLGGKDPGVSKFEMFKTRIDKCGFSAMLFKTIQCLMGGVTAAAAYDAAAKALLKSLEKANWEILFVGIPYHKQIEIKDRVNKEMGNLPPPWEWVPGKNEIPDDKMKVVEHADNVKSYEQQIMINDEKLQSLDTEWFGINDSIDQTMAKQSLAQNDDERQTWFDMQKELEKKQSDVDDRMEDIKRQNKKLKAKTGAFWKSDDKAYSDFKALSDDDKERIRKETAAYQKSLGSDPQSRYTQGSVGGGLGKAQQAAFDIYIDAIIEVWGGEHVLNFCERFPGAKFIVDAIRRWDCPYPNLFNPPAGSFMESFSLDICSGDASGKLSMPHLMSFGNLTWTNIIKILWQAILKQVTASLFKVLVTMIVKVLQILESALCKAIELAGRLAVNLITPGDQGGFMGAISDVFCGDQGTADDEQVTASNLFSALGINPSDIQGMNQEDLMDSHMKVAQTLSSVSTRNEIKELFISDSRDHDQNVLRRISKAVSLVNPEYASIFSDPNNISQLFAAAKNYLTPTQLMALREELDAPEDDVPVDDSICLTKAQLDKWNEDREAIFSELPGDLAKEWVDKQNDKAKTDLIEVCSLAARGVDGPMRDELDKLLNFETAMGDPACKKNTSAISFRTPETDAADEEAASGIFRSLTKEFQKDMIGGGWIWNKYGVVDHMLADRRGTPLRKHENRVRSSFLWPSWANTQEDYEAKKDDLAEFLGIPEDFIDWILPEDASGIFPDTVGILLQDELFKNDFHSDPKFSYGSGTSIAPQTGLKERWFGIDYSFTYSKPIMKDADMIWTYKDNLTPLETDKSEYGFAMHYRSFIINGLNTSETPMVSTKFDYEISLDSHLYYNESIDPETGVASPMPESVVSIEKFRMKVQNDIDHPRQEIIDSLEIQSSDLASMKYTYESLLWWKYCESRWSEFGVSLSKFNLAETSWKNISGKMFEDVANMMMNPNGDIASGFKYGYTSDSSIGFKDLLYVNPGADTDDESTWEYTYDEEEKVLGKSATNNPRVHFLDPDIHGGWYSWPKVYVDRFEYSGLLSVIQIMVPDIDGCPPKTTDFLDWKYLSNRQVEVKQKMIPDKRLTKDEECVKKIPFDLIQTNDIHGYIEASVLATVRTYVSEFILRSLPVISALEFNDRNYDDALAQMIVQNMETELPDQGSWLDWTWIKRYDYWLHFLEQAYQIVERRIDLKELHPTEEMNEVIDAIKKIQRSYVHVNNDVMENLEKNIHAESLPHLRDKYPDEDDEYFRGRRVLFLNDDPRPKDADYQIMKGASIIYFGRTADQITRFRRQGKAKWYDGMETRFSNNFFTIVHARRCAKLYSLHRGRKHCKKMLKHLVKEELQNYAEKIYNTLKPAATITSLSKYYIGASNSIINGGLRTGIAATETPHPATLESTGEVIETYIESIGDCVDVSSDISLYNPLDAEGLVVPDLDAGQFVVEKYVRIIDKPENESENVPDFIKNRPDNLRGVVSIKEFRKFVNENMINNPLFDQEAYNLSDLFGDAELLRNLQEKPTGLIGSVGFRFGVRLSLVPPNGFTVPEPDSDMLKIAQREKAFYLKKSSQGGMNTRHIFPLAVFEKDILDDKISKIDWEHEAFGEDFRCYIDNLVETPQFRLVFDNIFPLRRASSMVAIYTNFGWLPSIGKSDKERDTAWGDRPILLGGLADPDSQEIWGEGLFEGTKISCYRMFHGFYESDSWDWGWDWNYDFNFSIWFKDMMPKIFMNIDPTTRWWQRWRIERDRPFDKDGEQCDHLLSNLFVW